MILTKCIIGDEVLQLDEGRRIEIRYRNNGVKDIIYIKHEYDAVYGLGEKFDSLDQKGKKVVCKVEEKFCSS